MYQGKGAMFTMGGGLGMGDIVVNNHPLNSYEKKGFSSIPLYFGR